jgi:hypothetical protein
MRSRITAVLTGSIIALSAPLGWATSCLVKPDVDIVRNTKIAFVGSVRAVEASAFDPAPGLCWVATTEKPHCGGHSVVLEVSRPLRGKFKGTLRVLSEDSCYCLGQRWIVGEQYLIVAKPNHTKHEGDLVALSGCEGTSPLSRSGVESLSDKLSAPLK